MKKIGFLISLLLIFCVTFTESAYIDEYPESYTWAYKNGITTMKSIEKANMYGEITRIELSKMISNYAINVLKKNPDTSKRCEFNDISDKLDKQYDNGVTHACQLGLMGQGITKFRPHDKVTRAEFGTILSRLLYGEKYNGGNPYYIKHINNLNIRGIMTNIKNPEKVNESRGNVMVMLKRSETLGNVSILSFEELEDTAFQCYVCYPGGCGYEDEISGKIVCSPDECGYESIDKKGFIIPYKDGYIGYSWRDNMGDERLNLTYTKVENPCEIASQIDVFHYNYDNIQTAGCVLDYGYSDKKVDSFNSKEKDPRKCMDDAEKYFYKLIVGTEKDEYFTKTIDNFKQSIIN